MPAQAPTTLPRRKRAFRREAAQFAASRSREHQFAFPITKSYEAKALDDGTTGIPGAEVGDWITEGFAATSDLDLGQFGPPQLPTIRLLPPALIRIVDTFKALDLRTMFRNHDLNDEIGSWLELGYEADGERIRYRGKVSKTRPDIWEKDLDGTLSKHSLSFFIIDSKTYWDDAAGRMIQDVLDAVGIEISQVGVPMNPAARLTAAYVLQGGSAKRHETSPRRCRIALSLVNPATDSTGLAGFGAFGRVKDLEPAQRVAIEKALHGHAIVSREGKGVAKVTGARLLDDVIVLNASRLGGRLPADSTIELDLLASDDDAAILGLAFGPAPKEKGMKTSLARMNEIRTNLKAYHAGLEVSGDEKALEDIRGKIEADYDALVEAGMADLPDPLDIKSKNMWLDADEPDAAAKAKAEAEAKAKADAEAAAAKAKADDGEKARVAAGAGGGTGSEQAPDEVQVRQALSVVQKALGKKGATLAGQVGDELFPTADVLARKAADVAVARLEIEIKASREKHEREMAELRAELKSIGGSSSGSRRDSDDTAGRHESTGDGPDLSDLTAAEAKQLKQWF